MMYLLPVVLVQRNKGNSLSSPLASTTGASSQAGCRAADCTSCQGTASVAKSEMLQLSCRLWLSQARQQEVMLPLHPAPQLRKSCNKQVSWHVVIKLVPVTLMKDCAYDPRRHLMAHLQGLTHPMPRRRGTKVHPLRQALPVRGCTCTCSAPLCVQEERVNMRW